MTDLMRNSANFALTDTVYKSRSIAQGQDSERNSSNFRLADNRLRIHPHGGSHAGGDQIECPTINKTLNV